MNNDPFEQFLQALEDLVDARDDAWIEEENCNYKLSDKILTERAEPARQRMREAFNMAVRDAIKKYPAVQKIYSLED
jgi:succinylglutamate desuccinylase